MIKAKLTKTHIRTHFNLLKLQKHLNNKCGPQQKKKAGKKMKYCSACKRPKREKNNFWI